MQPVMRLTKTDNRIKQTKNNWENIYNSFK